jgi:hypothetical protein
MQRTHRPARQIVPAGYWVRANVSRRHGQDEHGLEAIIDDLAGSTCVLKAIAVRLAEKDQRPPCSRGRQIAESDICGLIPHDHTNLIRSFTEPGGERVDARSRLDPEWKVIFEFAG